MARLGPLATDFRQAIQDPALKHLPVYSNAVADLYFVVGYVAQGTPRLPNPHHDPEAQQPIAALLKSRGRHLESFSQVVDQSGSEGLLLLWAFAGRTDAQNSSTGVYFNVPLDTLASRFRLDTLTVRDTGFLLRC